MAPKAAFITGANGITGSAIAEYLAKNTTKEEWSEIIITSRSPLKLPFSDPRIKFVALDFSKPAKDLVPAFKEVCGSVTHAYFSSYVHRDDFAELNAANAELFDNFMDALVESAPKLENVTLQTGGKWYNVHLIPVPSPCSEEDEVMPAPLDNFYVPQQKKLHEAAQKHGFKYNEIRPEAIVGCTQKPNGMNEALTIAIYLIVAKELGEDARMPTNQRYWEGTDDVSSSELIADITVWCSTSDKCANQAFNVTNGDYFCWKYMWPRLAKCFGAKATSGQVFEKEAPKEGTVQLDLSLSEWSQGKQEVWDRICDRAGSPDAKATWHFATFGFQDWVFQRTWSATLSMNKARKYGWTKSIDTYDNFRSTFQKFSDLGLIPKGVLSA